MNKLKEFKQFPHINDMDNTDNITIKNDTKTADYLDPNTKKFKEGNPGGGRPKGSGISITTEIKKKLAEIPEGSKASYLEMLLNRILKKAIQQGDSQMISKIWAYIDGMPKGITINMAQQVNMLRSPEDLLENQLKEIIE